MALDRLLRADAATERGLARLLEQYARLLAASRRRDGLHPADTYCAAKTLASSAALLRLHLQKYALYAEAAAAADVFEPDEPNEPDPARRLLRASRSMRGLLLQPRAVSASNLQASASLAELEAFYARKREARAVPEPASPSPPWLHPKVNKS
ncbi:MAG TPA: hypothetical protein VEZ72_22470 [Paenibacillus sp.]|nr:hypothetical protein [Paenibacillus sp.]